MMLLIGYALGFVGYLPIGNINMAVVQVAVSETRRTLWGFILFIAFMEFVYCFACMLGMNYLLQQPQLVLGLKWVSVAIFLLLGLASLLQKTKPDKPTAVAPGLARGIFIAIFNPLQIPFWLVWGVYVLQNKWVENHALHIVVFSLICSVGTISVLWLYAEAGRKVVEKLKLNQIFLTRMIGLLFIGLAVYETVKLI